MNGVALTEELLGRAFQPPENCESFTDSNTLRFGGRHYYSFKSEVLGDIREHVFSSDNMDRSNILKLIENSLREKTFVSLDVISIKEYAKRGGGDIPACMLKCRYEHPICVRQS